MYAAMNNNRQQRLEDDQTVPELSFDVVTIDGGATVFEAPPLPVPTTPRKSLPDFDSLLDGLTSSYDIIISGNSATCPSLMDTPVDSTPLRTWELEAYNDISMYDDIPLQNFKPEKYQSVEVKQEESLFVGDQQFQDLAERIRCVCHTLAIPNNPYCWSVEHTQRWLLWALKTYSLPEYYCDQFVMSGAALCFLSADDFRQRSAQAGDFLSTELDIWKTAHNLALSPELSPQSEECTVDYYQQQQLEDMPTFTDLDAVPCNSILPQVSEPLKAIPTPVITHSQQYMTSSLNPSLGADSRGVYCSPSSVSPAPSMDSLTTSSSSLQSCGDLDDSSNSQEMTVCYRDVSPVPHHGKHTIHLWQFLKELLLQPHLYQGCIRWLDRPKGIFKIEDSGRVAKLWGARKNRPAMNYDKLSRSIRQYYKKGIIKKTSNSKRLVYQFCPQYV